VFLLARQHPCSLHRPCVECCLRRTPATPLSRNLWLCVYSLMCLQRHTLAAICYRSVRPAASLTRPLHPKPIGISHAVSYNKQGLPLLPCCHCYPPAAQLSAA
jgi:hypothetical protein